MYSLIHPTYSQITSIIIIIIIVITSSNDIPLPEMVNALLEIFQEFTSDLAS